MGPGQADRPARAGRCGEVGRQPWIIYGLLRTSDALSYLPVKSVAFTTAGFFWTPIRYPFVADKWFGHGIISAFEADLDKKNNRGGSAAVVMGLLPFRERPCIDRRCR